MKQSIIYFRLFFLSLSLLPIVVGCNQTEKGRDVERLQEWVKEFEVQDNRFAQGFSIAQKEDLRLLTVINPWDSTEITAHYLLYSGEKPIVPSSVICVKIPIQRTGVTSCTHIGFLDLLSELNSICGISYPDRVYNAQVRELIDSKAIIDIGDPFNLDLEKALSLQPDLLWISGYADSDEYSARIQKSGLPIVFVNEWMEADVLARAEWIRFIAAFYDKLEFADRYFEEVSGRYIQLVDSLQPVQSTPKILSGEDFRGSWYMPTTDNWLAKMYIDAKGSYIVPSKSQRGSVSFTLEEALSFFSDSDIWMGVDANSLNQLKQKEGRYILFKPFKLGRVFNYSRRSTPSGGNDFWERAVVEPDVLLRDFASVFHPEWFKLYEPKYVEQLKL